MRAFTRISSRLTALLLYILRTCAKHQQASHCRFHPITLRSLLACCYLTDREAYRQRLAPITHATYRARPEGPVPDGFYRLVTRLARRGRIRLTPPFPHRSLTAQDLDCLIALPSPVHGRPRSAHLRKTRPLAAPSNTYSNAYLNYSSQVQS